MWVFWQQVLLQILTESVKRTCVSARVVHLEDSPRRALGLHTHTQTQTQTQTHTHTHTHTHTDIKTKTDGCIDCEDKISGTFRDRQSSNTGHLTPHTEHPPSAPAPGSVSSVIMSTC